MTNEGDGAESTRQRNQDEEPFPSDAIEINISIEDEIVIEDELHHMSLIGKEELEMSNVDIVDHHMQRGLKAVLEEYQRLREEKDV